METKHLRQYAPQARRDFIEAVGNRAAFYGLLPERILPAHEKGDVVLIDDRPFPIGIAPKRKKLVNDIADVGYEQFIESIAYTWFNRLVAIRFMELHGYLSHGYRVLSHPNDGLSPEALEYAERLELPHLERNLVVDLKLDGTRDEELYRLILVAQCEALYRAMPFMFGTTNDATELLLPDNLLHSDSVIQKLVRALTPEDFSEVEAVGWLYQFYISEKKDDVFAALKKGKKITPENIPAATQLFTPHWIVRYLVENSLGRLWMLNHPDSRLAEQMDYYIKPEEPETDFLRISSPEEIKICDPACGSGHMLTYAFDLLYAIYEEQGYQATDIPRLILTHNLYGIEIDQRAGALAAFALTMKAREKYRRFLTGGKVVQPNICVLENVKIDPEDLSAYMDKVGRDLFSGGLQGVVNQWEEADNFGSLIRPLVTDVSEVLELLRERQMDEDLFLAGVHQKVLKALRQADYLSPKYHVVVANPPYMGGGGQDTKLKAFLKSNYRDAKSDLFSAFVVRNVELTVESGQLGFMTPFVWMFIPSFEPFRQWLIEASLITSLIQLEYSGFDGATVPICTFTIQNSAPLNRRGTYVKLSDFKGSQLQGPKALEAISSDACTWRYVANQKQFLTIPTAPIAYWASAQVFSLFESGQCLGDVSKPRTGLNTTNNARFTRLWHEITFDNFNTSAKTLDDSAVASEKWYPFQKGGEYRKWYGNHEYVVNWRNNGYDIREATKDCSGGRVLSSEFYFNEGVCWSTITSSNFSARYFPSGFIFSNAAGGIFSDKLNVIEIASLTNSKIPNYLFNLMNPTLNYSSGLIARCPVVDFEANETLTKEAVNIAKTDWDEFELSWEFASPALLAPDHRVSALQHSYSSLRAHWNTRTARMQAIEERNNRQLIDAYGLRNELEPIAKLDQITLSCNPYHRYDEDKSDSELEALLLADTMREFISYAVGCMLGRYSLDKPGLILANQGETADDYRKQIPEPTFAPDEDNVIPLLDGDWFTDDISERFKEFLKVTFGTEHYEENLTFLENSLFPANLEGKKRKTIRDYFLKEFYNHHIKLYKKRPIYWMFSSGKQGGFRALIYMHRYNPSTLSRMRTAYVVPLQGKYNSRIDQLEGDIPAATSTSHRRKLEKERDSLIKRRVELQEFDEKLRHYADRRIEIDLDDGVKVNYGKFGDLLDQVKAIHGKKPEEI